MVKKFSAEKEIKLKASNTFSVYQVVDTVKVTESEDGFSTALSGIGETKYIVLTDHTFNRGYILSTEDYENELVQTITSEKANQVPHSVEQLPEDENEAAAVQSSVVGPTPIGDPSKGFRLMPDEKYVVRRVKVPKEKEKVTVTKKVLSNVEQILRAIVALKVDYKVYLNEDTKKVIVLNIETNVEVQLEKTEYTTLFVRDAESAGILAENVVDYSSLPVTEDTASEVVAVKDAKSVFTAIIAKKVHYKVYKDTLTDNAVVINTKNGVEIELLPSEYLAVFVKNAEMKGIPGENVVNFSKLPTAKVNATKMVAVTDKLVLVVKSLDKAKSYTVYKDPDLNEVVVTSKEEMSTDIVAREIDYHVYKDEDAVVVVNPETDVEVRIEESQYTSLFVIGAESAGVLSAVNYTSLPTTKETATSAVAVKDAKSAKTAIKAMSVNYTVYKDEDTNKVVVLNIETNVEVQIEPSEYTALFVTNATIDDTRISPEDVVDYSNLPTTKETAIKMVAAKNEESVPVGEKVSKTTITQEEYEKTFVNDPTSDFSPPLFKDLVTNSSSASAFKPAENLDVEIAKKPASVLASISAKEDYKVYKDTYTENVVVINTKTGVETQLPEFQYTALFVTEASAKGIPAEKVLNYTSLPTTKIDASNVIAATDGIIPAVMSLDKSQPYTVYKDSVLNMVIVTGSEAAAERTGSIFKVTITAEEYEKTFVNDPISDSSPPLFEDLVTNKTKAPSFNPENNLDVPTAKTPASVLSTITAKTVDYKVYKDTVTENVIVVNTHTQVETQVTQAQYTSLFVTNANAAGIPAESVVDYSSLPSDEASASQVVAVSDGIVPGVMPIDKSQSYTCYRDPNLPNMVIVIGDERIAKRSGTVFKTTMTQEEYEKTFVNDPTNVNSPPLFKDLINSSVNASSFSPESSVDIATAIMSETGTIEAKSVDYKVYKDVLTENVIVINIKTEVEIQLPESEYTKLFVQDAESEGIPIETVIDYHSLPTTKESASEVVAASSGIIPSKMSIEKSEAFTVYKDPNTNLVIVEGDEVAAKESGSLFRITMTEEEYEKTFVNDPESDVSPPLFEDLNTEKDNPIVVDASKSVEIQISSVPDMITEKTPKPSIIEETIELEVVVETEVIIEEETVSEEEEIEGVDFTYEIVLTNVYTGDETSLTNEEYKEAENLLRPDFSDITPKDDPEKYLPESESAAKSLSLQDDARIEVQLKIEADSSYLINKDPDTGEIRLENSVTKTEILISKKEYARLAQFTEKSSVGNPVEALPASIEKAAKVEAKETVDIKVDFPVLKGESFKVSYNEDTEKVTLETLIAAEDGTTTLSGKKTILTAKDYVEHFVETLPSETDANAPPSIALQIESLPRIGTDEEPVVVQVDKSIVIPTTLRVEENAVYETYQDEATNKVYVVETIKTILIDEETNEETEVEELVEYELSKVEYDEFYKVTQQKGVSSDTNAPTSDALASGEENKMTVKVDEPIKVTVPKQIDPNKSYTVYQDKETDKIVMRDESGKVAATLTEKEYKDFQKKQEETKEPEEAPKLNNLPKKKSQASVLKSTKKVSIPIEKKVEVGETFKVFKKEEEPDADAVDQTTLITTVVVVDTQTDEVVEMTVNEYETLNTAALNGAAPPVSALIVKDEDKTIEETILEIADDSVVTATNTADVPASMPIDKGDTLTAHVDADTEEVVLTTLKVNEITGDSKKTVQRVSKEEYNTLMRTDSIAKSDEGTSASLLPSKKKKKVVDDDTDTDVGDVTEEEEVEGKKFVATSDTKVETELQLKPGNAYTAYLDTTTNEVVATDSSGFSYKISQEKYLTFIDSVKPKKPLKPAPMTTKLLATTKSKSTPVRLAESITEEIVVNADLTLNPEKSYAIFTDTISNEVMVVNQDEPDEDPIPITTEEYKYLVTESQLVIDEVGLASELLPEDATEAQEVKAHTITEIPVKTEVAVEEVFTAKLNAKGDKAIVENAKTGEIKEFTPSEYQVFAALTVKTLVSKVVVDDDHVPSPPPPPVTDVPVRIEAPLFTQLPKFVEEPTSLEVETAGEIETTLKVEANSKFSIHKEVDHTGQTNVVVTKFNGEKAVISETNYEDILVKNVVVQPLPIPIVSKAESLPQEETKARLLVTKKAITTPAIVSFQATTDTEYLVYRRSESPEQIVLSTSNGESLVEITETEYSQFNFVLADYMSIPFTSLPIADTVSHAQLLKSTTTVAIDTELELDSSTTFAVHFEPHIKAADGSKVQDGMVKVKNEKTKITTRMTKTEYEALSGKMTKSVEEDLPSAAFLPTKEEQGIAIEVHTTGTIRTDFSVKKDHVYTVYKQGDSGNVVVKEISIETGKVVGTTMSEEEYVEFSQTITKGTTTAAGAQAVTASLGTRALKSIETAVSETKTAGGIILPDSYEDLPTSEDEAEVVTAYKDEEIKVELSLTPAKTTSKVPVEIETTIGQEYSAYADESTGKVVVTDQKTQVVYEMSEDEFLTMAAASPVTEEITANKPLTVHKEEIYDEMTGLVTGVNVIITDPETGKEQKVSESEYTASVLPSVNAGKTIEANSEFSLYKKNEKVVLFDQVSGISTFITELEYKTIVVPASVAPLSFENLPTDKANAQTTTAEVTIKVPGVPLVQASKDKKFKVFKDEKTKEIAVFDSITEEIILMSVEKYEDFVEASIVPQEVSIEKGDKLKVFQNVDAGTDKIQIVIMNLVGEEITSKKIVNEEEYEQVLREIPELKENLPAEIKHLPKSEAEATASQKPTVITSVSVAKPFAIEQPPNMQVGKGKTYKVHKDPDMPQSRVIVKVEEDNEVYRLLNKDYEEFARLINVEVLGASAAKLSDASVSDSDTRVNTAVQKLPLTTEYLPLTAELAISSTATTDFRIDQSPVLEIEYWAKYQLYATTETEGGKAPAVVVTNTITNEKVRLTKEEYKMFRTKVEVNDASLPSDSDEELEDVPYFEELPQATTFTIDKGAVYVAFVDDSDETVPDVVVITDSAGNEQIMSFLEYELMKEKSFSLSDTFPTSALSLPKTNTISDGVTASATSSAINIEIKPMDSVFKNIFKPKDMSTGDLPKPVFSKTMLVIQDITSLPTSLDEALELTAQRESAVPDKPLLSIQDTDILQMYTDPAIPDSVIILKTDTQTGTETVVTVSEKDYVLKIKPVLSASVAVIDATTGEETGEREPVVVPDIKDLPVTRIAAKAEVSFDVAPTRAGKSEIIVEASVVPLIDDLPSSVLEAKPIEGVKRVSVKSLSTLTTIADLPTSKSEAVVIKPDTAGVSIKSEMKIPTDPKKKTPIKQTIKLTDSYQLYKKSDNEVILLNQDTKVTSKLTREEYLDNFVPYIEADKTTDTTVTDENIIFDNIPSSLNEAVPIKIKETVTEEFSVESTVESVSEGSSFTVSKTVDPITKIETVKVVDSSSGIEIALSSSQYTEFSLLTKKNPVASAVPVASLPVLEEEAKEMEVPEEITEPVTVQVETKFDQGSAYLIHKEVEVVSVDEISGTVISEELVFIKDLATQSVVKMTKQEFSKKLSKAVKTAVDDLPNSEDKAAEKAPLVVSHNVITKTEFELQLDESVEVVANPENELEVFVTKVKVDKITGAQMKTEKVSMAIEEYQELANQLTIPEEESKPHNFNALPTDPSSPGVIGSASKFETVTVKTTYTAAAKSKVELYIDEETSHVVIVDKNVVTSMTKDEYKEFQEQSFVSVTSGVTKPNVNTDYESLPIGKDNKVEQETLSFASTEVILSITPDSQFSVFKDEITKVVKLVDQESGETVAEMNKNEYKELVKATAPVPIDNTKDESITTIAGLPTSQKEAKSFVAVEEKEVKAEITIEASTDYSF